MTTLDNTLSAFDLAIEPLETLEAPFNWGDFWSGVGIGVGLVAIAAT